MRGQRSRRADRECGETWVSLETPLPTHAPRGSVEMPLALLRPCAEGRFSPQFVGEPWLRCSSETLLLSALKLQRHSEPLRERPVPASRTCLALPGPARGVGFRPGARRPRVPQPSRCAPPSLRQPAVDGAGWVGGGRGYLGSCAASPALGAPGQPRAGRRGAARGRVSAGNTVDPSPAPSGRRARARLKWFGGLFVCQAALARGLEVVYGFDAFEPIPR